MKVENGSPIANRPLRPARPGGQVGGPSFSSHLQETGSTGGARASGPVGGAVLAAMHALDPQERRRQGMRRGRRLLDLLDDLRDGLLSGGVPRQVIGDLARAVGEAQAEIDDPALSDLLGEIDLRVQVELAKHERTLASP